MKRKLQLILTWLLLFLGTVGLSFAQNLGKGSRLDIGKKTAAKSPLSFQKNKALSHLPLSSKFFVSEIRYRKPEAINQYFKTALLQNSKTAKPVIVPAESVAERNERQNTELMPTNEKFFANEKISLSNAYPNPANDYAMVDYEVKGNFSEAKVIIYNTFGSQIGEYELDKFDRNLRIPTNDLSSGTYLYQLSIDGQKVRTKRLFVRHQ